MSRTKEADLISAAFLYAARCLAEDDSQALRQMNFGTREVAAVRELTVTDLQRAGKLSGHFLDIRLERTVFWQIMAHLERERAAESVQHALVRLDAPLEMLQALFGLGAREHTMLCSLLGVRPSVGRPPVPDEATTERVWTAYRARAEAREDGELAADDYLELQRETGAPLRAIWPLVQAWQRDGETGEPATGLTRPPAADETTGERAVALAAREA